MFVCADSVINRFAGDGTPGYLDGKAGNSRFNKTRGFAIDAKGNVYVADKNNKVIRKISSSGVCFIHFLYPFPLNASCYCLILVWWKSHLVILIIHVLLTGLCRLCNHHCWRNFKGIWTQRWTCTECNFL